MDAAAYVFAERGPEATLNDIAQAAGVGVGTVYRKFADKEALFDALFDEKIDALVDLAQQASKLTEAGAAFRELLLGVMTKRASDRGLDAILTSPEQGARFATELGRRFLPTADRLVARAVEAGELRADFSASEVCILGFMVGKVADITRETDPTVWRRYAQMLIDGTRPAEGGAPLAPGPLSFEENLAALGRAG
jgi:AcrR family transcriptional regulator